ncbi:MAG: SIMPL domain-containing protein [Ignavibacteriaceae bacterium]|nr:SIMPL domain-containing protein [Ignavibacteriaceae bacterium]
MNETNKGIIATAVGGVFLLIAVIIINNTLSDRNKDSQTINVTGSAKMDIVSDLGILAATVSSQSSSPQEAYRQMKNQLNQALVYLEGKGFKKDVVALSPPSSYDIYEISASGYTTQNVIGRNYSQRFEIKSPDVQLIKAISLEIVSLIEKGVNVVTEQPRFIYTKLADVKIQVQAEAAKDAMDRANRVAAATDRALGELRTARMGVLQITPKNSNQISDYGINDEYSIEKEITAVVNASFVIY